MSRWGVRGLVLAAAVVAGAGSAAPVLPGVADAAGVIPAESVRVVAEPGITLHVPVDGRLNGDGFAAQITGYRFTDQVGFGPSTEKAAPGQQLLVFGLLGAPLVAGTDAQGNPTPTVTPLLVVDGAEQPLPAPANQDNGTTFFLASIPARPGPVSLQIGSQGFTQTFSFTTGTRTGPQPEILYRALGSWAPTDPIDQTVTVATPDPAEGIPDAAIDVTINQASLTWFGPDSPSDNPPSDGQAWLVLDATSAAHPLDALGIGSQLNYLSTLGPSQVTLTIPGQAAPVPAELAGQGGPADQSTNYSGWFGGIYYWPVPATLDTATITITPGTITAESNYLGSPQRITVAGSFRFSVSFAAPFVPGPPPASPPPNAISSAAAGTHHSSTTTKDHPAGTGGHGFVAWPLLAAVVAALAVAAAWFVVRRRRSPLTPALAGVGHPSASTEVPVSPPTWPAPATTVPHPIAPAATPTESNGSTPTDGSVAVDPPHPPLPESARSDGRVRVKVLGSPRLIGWPADVPPPGQTAVEILTFLALHPGQRFTTEQIRTRMGTGRDRDLGPETIRRYIGELRRGLGREVVPETRAGAGYEVRHVATDVAELLTEADTARRSATPSERAVHLTRALAAVRAAPFSHVPKGGYGWADTDPALNAGLTNTILDLSRELATSAVDAGAADLAAWAADRGLLVAPTDQDLHRLYLAAAAAARPSRVDRAWSVVGDRLAARGEQPSPELEAHYHHLRRS